MSKEFEINIGLQVIPVNEEHRGQFRAISQSEDCKFLSEWLKEVSILKRLESRQLLEAGKYEQARIVDMYVYALEDVVLLVKEGITEALRNPEE